MGSLYQRGLGVVPVSETGCRRDGFSRKGFGLLYFYGGLYFRVLFIVGLVERDLYSSSVLSRWMWLGTALNGALWIIGDWFLEGLDRDAFLGHPGAERK